MRWFKIYIGSIIVSVLIISFSEFLIDSDLESTAKNIEGNTVANSVGDPFIAKQGSWLYFCYPVGYDYHLIAKKENLAERKVLKRGYFDNLNVIGDHLFYLATDSTDEFQTYIFKSELDGSKPVKVSAFPATSFYIRNGWIYFHHNYAIFRIRTDGTGFRQLDSGSYISNMVVVGEWIYYLDSKNELSLMKIKTDGTEKSVLFNEKVSCFVADEENIYFYISVMADSKKHGLYIGSTEGKHAQKITSDEVISLQLDKYYLYYISPKDSEDYTFCLKRMAKDDGNPTVIRHGLEVDEWVYMFGDWLYFNSGSEIMRLKKDGSKLESFYSSEF